MDDTQRIFTQSLNIMQNPKQALKEQSRLATIVPRVLNWGAIPLFAILFYCDDKLARGIFYCYGALSIFITMHLKDEHRTSLIFFTGCAFAFGAYTLWQYFLKGA